MPITENVNIKRILAIAIPLIIQRSFLQLQIYVDRAMLGHVNSDYFSAIGNVLVPYFAVNAIITAICTGTAILVAQCIGAKDEAQGETYAECSFMGNALLSLIAFAFFFFASGPMFMLMGVQSPVLEHSTSYIKILSVSLLALGLSTTAISIMQGIGITKIIMYAGIVSNILNILFDWILIFGKWGAPQMGIDGAALASVIASFATAPILIIYIFVGKKIPFKLSIANAFRFRWHLYKNVFKVGVPSGIEFALWHLGNFVVVSFLNRLDTISVGIYVLVFAISNFPFLIYMGFANAALTLVGQKTGEKEHEQAIHVGFMCLCLALIFCILFAALCIMLPKQILGIFTNDTSYIDYASSFLLILSVTMFPRAINNVIGLGIRGMGDTKWMLYGQMLGTVLVITLSYVLSFIAQMGLMGIFMAFLIDEFVRGIINILRFWKGREFFFLKPFENVIEKTGDTP
jgi:putative MATE family efflux protein